jgi:hypothetical protein
MSVSEKRTSTRWNVFQIGGKEWNRHFPRIFLVGKLNYLLFSRDYPEAQTL